jgi:hypothetical protein
MIRRLAVTTAVTAAAASALVIGGNTVSPATTIRALA